MTPAGAHVARPVPPRGLHGRLAGALLCLSGAALAFASPEPREPPREPLPGDIEGTVSPDDSRRPLDAIEAERRITVAELADLERRMTALGTTRELRKERLRVRLRALYKLSQGGFGRLLLGVERPLEMYGWRDGARRVIARDVEELLALRDELRVLEQEQTRAAQGTARVATLLAEAARARAEGRDRDLLGLGALRGELPRPVSPGEVLTPYGREVVERGLELYHNGVELSAEPGASVRAVAAGQVRYTGEMAGLSTGVILEHPGGYLTVYGRLSRLLVVPGGRVAAGTVLGQAAAGRVYFQLTLGDLPLDPEPWLASGGRRRP